MAAAKSLYTCTIFLLLLLSDVAPHAQGRRLFRRRHKGCKRSCPVQGGQTRDETGGGTFAGLNADIARRKVLLVEDSETLRPTAPGHSPGVGHLFEGEAAQKDADSGSHTLSVDTQDARPTLPGHSPGVGHALQDRKNANDVVDHSLSAADVQDIRPTMPGHSPGIGHSSENKQSEGEIVDGKFSAERGSTVGTDQDLRPTEPGHSPGVGHSFGNKGD